MFELHVGLLQNGHHRVITSMVHGVSITEFFTNMHESYAS
jgi:hypothetical protein